MRLDIQKTDIRFTEELSVMNGGIRILKCWGVATDGMRMIWRLDHEGNWSRIIPNHVYAETIINAIYKRLKEIYNPE